MINRDIINLLRRHRGEILGSITGRDDMLYVKLVRKDLIEALAKNLDSDIGFGFEVRGTTGYFDRDYSTDNNYDGVA